LTKWFYLFSDYCFYYVKGRTDFLHRPATAVLGFTRGIHRSLSSIIPELDLASRYSIT